MPCKYCKDTGKILLLNKYVPCDCKSVSAPDLLGSIIKYKDIYYVVTAVDYAFITYRECTKDGVVKPASSPNFSRKCLLSDVTEWIKEGRLTVIGPCLSIG